MEKIRQVTLSLPWPEHSRRAFSIQAEVPHSNKNPEGYESDGERSELINSSAQHNAGTMLLTAFSGKHHPLTTLLHLLLKMQGPILGCVAEKPTPELITHR